MVHQYGTGFVEGLPTLSVKSQTQVDIVKRDGKIGFVKPTDCKETVAPDQHAGCSDCSDELRQRMAVEVPFVGGRQEAMGMTCRVAHSDHDAGMLYPAVRIEQLSADRANVVAQRVRRHDR